MLGVVYQGVAFPLLFTMLPKWGNSNCLEKIALVGRFIGLFGRNAIDAITADREFACKEWLDYLNRNQIKYLIKASPLFNQLDIIQ